MPASVLSNSPRGPVQPIRNEIFGGVDLHLTTQNDLDGPARCKLAYNVRFNNELCSSIDGRTSWTGMEAASSEVFQSPSDSLIS